VLVSVCYIDLLSVFVFLTYIVFLFREQKMVQRIQELVAKYEDRLREIQSDIIVPYNTYHFYVRVIGLGSGYLFFSDLALSCRTILINFYVRVIG